MHTDTIIDTLFNYITRIYFHLILNAYISVGRFYPAR